MSKPCISDRRPRCCRLRGDGAPTYSNDDDGGEFVLSRPLAKGGTYRQASSEPPAYETRRSQQRAIFVIIPIMLVGVPDDMCSAAD